VTRLTVLGSSGTHVGPGRMCSSYLLEAEGLRLLLDCGNGSLSNLQRLVDVAELDAVLLSHQHPDHFADLYSLYYALRFHRGGPRSVLVYAPAGTQAHLAQLLDDERAFAETCRFTEVAAGVVLELGPVRLTLFSAAHPVETLAVRAEIGPAVIAYSADSGPSPQVVACAREADLFICDSSWLERDGPYPEGLHMTGAQAGRHAAEAGVRRLLCSHLVPGVDAAAVVAEAAQSFDGEVLPAADLQEHVL
jgi:ribonuclease BN (tRNA processing enzyme)